MAGVLSRNFGRNGRSVLTPTCSTNMSDSHTTSVASTVAEKLATTATYGGSASAVFFGLNAAEFAAIAGVAIAFAGLLANIWFKYQHLQIAKQEANADTNNGD